MAVIWRVSEDKILYPDAVLQMEEKIALIRENSAAEEVWLLEHPPLYTAGTSANAEDLLDSRFPVFASGRGGQYTYHGPGQRIAYVMLDLKRRGMMDLHAYIWHLEEWLIRTLARFNIEGFRRVGRVGVWVLNAKGGEAKIAALGIRVRQWVAYHGVALNIDPNLEHFSGIVPCGIKGFGVTSMYEMGQFPSMEEVDMQLRDVFSEVFL